MVVAVVLTDTQRRSLLDVAREAVAAQVANACVVTPSPDEFPRASGVFVTLRARGELRGCLGTLECRQSLAEEVARTAAESATQDPRFEPVSPEELAEITIEISVLGPLERIDPHDSAAIDIGRHGLVVEHGRRRGLLLPQVATEWGWTREQFLRQTCVKAGLPPDAWRHAAAVYRFGAEVFGD